MNKTIPSFLLFIMGLFFTVLMIAACSSDFAANVRKVTYPPDFKYVSAQELRSGMEKMAFQLQLLDQALLTSNSEQIMEQQQQQQQQQKVMDALRNIEKIGAKLQAGEGGASHPFLQDFMGGFVSKVTEARIAASLDKPRYYLAGKVSGGCVNCHKINR